MKKCDNCGKAIDEKGPYIASFWRVIQDVPRVVCFYHVQCFDAEAKRCTL